MKTVKNKTKKYLIGDLVFHGIPLFQAVATSKADIFTHINKGHTFDNLFEKIMKITNK